MMRTQAQIGIDSASVPSASWVADVPTAPPDANTFLVH
jgi:hypothetical protein